MVANIGHGNPRVLAAMAEQAGRVTFAYPRFFESEHSVALSDRVCALAGEGFERAVFVSGGSEANESALKQARLSEHGLRNGTALYNRRANLGAYGDIQLITPPLTISAAEVDGLVGMLEKLLNDVADEVTRSGVRLA